MASSTWLFFEEDPAVRVVSQDTANHAAQQIAQNLVPADAAPGQYTKRVWVLPADNVRVFDCTVTISMNKDVQVVLVP